MNSRIFSILLLFILLGVGFSCQKQNPDPGSLLYRLEEIASNARSDNHNLRCLIVYQNDKIIDEEYYQLTNSDTPHDVRSVTKSIMSTLIGSKFILSFYFSLFTIDELVIFIGNCLFLLISI